MRSFHNQDIQTKIIKSNRKGQNGNISYLSQVPSDQMMNGSSLPNSPSKDRMNLQQQHLPKSHNKPKNVYEQPDSVKEFLMNDENDFYNKDIKKVNLNISPFTNKISNNINLSNNSTNQEQKNNKSSMNNSQLLKKNVEIQKKEIDDNLQKSLNRVNESAPRMKSDHEYNMQKQLKKNIEIKVSEQISFADNSHKNSNDISNPSQMKQFQDYERKYSYKNGIQSESDKYQQVMTLSVKYPVQQGVINLFDYKKGDEQSLSKSDIQTNRVNTSSSIVSNEQRSSTNLNGTTPEKNINYYSIQQQFDISKNAADQKNSFISQVKQADQLQAKNSQEFYQTSGVAQKNQSTLQNTLNSYRQKQQDQKGFSQQLHIALINQNNDSIDDQVTEDDQQDNTPGGGFYGEKSPQLPKPVEMPVFDMKIFADAKQNQKDLLPNKRTFSQQKKIQTPITNQNNNINNSKNKQENTKREIKKVNQQEKQTAREQRIIVVCETSNQTREWVNRFLAMRNIFEYESFTLPGGPGCFTLENYEERNCWQNIFKQFVLNMNKIYQISEIYIFQNSISNYPNIFQTERKTVKGQVQNSLHENLKQACSYVKESIQIPVKGFNINSKGIVEKI